MKKITCLLLCIFFAIVAKASERYEIQLGSHTLTCVLYKGGYWCDLPEEDLLHNKIWGMLPYIQTDDKWTWLQNYLAFRGLTIFDTFSVVCPENTNLSIKRILGLSDSGFPHEIYVLLENNDMSFYVQTYSDIRKLSQESIFTKEVIEQDLCTLKFTHNDFFLFDKWFSCNKIENKSEDTVKFECKLDDSDPQYKTLFGQNSYLAQNPIFRKPKKFLNQMIKDKEFGCEKHTLFSCSNKNTAVGICSGKEGETFIQVTPYVVFTLTNTDLEHSIADKIHAEELCNLSWDNFAL